MKTIYFKALLVIILLVNCGGSNAQTTPANTLQQLVSPFTGDFNYNVPLLMVPNANGMPININLGYHAGIGMQQQASWVGLGWGCNPGEITRSLNGIPDDWNGNSIYVDSIYTACANQPDKNSNTELKYYGPLHFKDMQLNQTNQIMDISISNLKGEQKSDGKIYQEPAYDNFNVSGPGISGQMQVGLFEYASLKAKSSENFNVKNAGDISPSPDDDPTCKRFEKSPQFYFTKYFSNAPKKNITANNVTTAEWDLTNNYSTFNPHNAPDYSIDYNSTNNRAYQGRYIEYFTNRDIIQSFDPSDDNNVMVKHGFLDYQTPSEAANNPRPGLGNLDDIGAFNITLENGYTYHYSLPVYSTLPTIISYDYTIDEPWFVSVFIQEGAQYFYSYFKRTYAEKRYVSSWKLTAITGPDYKDANHNGIADDGDAGDWVRYDYGLWCNNYVARLPEYGSEEDPLNRKYYRQEREVPLIPQKVISTTYNQIYYLNNITTRSHTAFFIKDIRDDDMDDSIEMPLLYLKRILLVKNEDFDRLDSKLMGNFSNTYVTSKHFSQDCIPSNCANPTLSSGEDIPDDTPPDNCHIYQEELYRGTKTSFEAYLLADVQLNYDYSLCKYLYNNINTKINTSVKNHVANLCNCDGNCNWIDVTGSTTTFSSIEFDGLQSPPCQSGYEDSTGKLTLKGIEFKGNGNVSVLPPYGFDYTSNDYVDGVSWKIVNPNYDPDLIDFWGLYKSDRQKENGVPVTGKYTTPISSLNTDAWSLRKIISPQGGEIHVKYAPDEYSQVKYATEDNTNTILKQPKMTFLFDLLVGVELQTTIVHLESDLQSIDYLENPPYSEFFSAHCNDVGMLKLTNENSFYNNTSDSYITSVKTNFPYFDADGQEFLTETWINNGTNLNDRFWRQTTIAETDCYQSTISNCLYQGQTSDNRIDTFIVGCTAIPNGIRIEPNIGGFVVGNGIKGLSWYPNQGYKGDLEFSFNKMYGGGLRVSDIKIKDPTDSQNDYALAYTYSNGICTQEPSVYRSTKIYDEWADPTGMPPRKYPEIPLLAFSNPDDARYALGPNVGYSNVTVTEVGSNGGMHGKTVYSYRNIDQTDEVANKPYDVYVNLDGRTHTTNSGCVDEEDQFVEVEDRSSLYGAPLKTEVYDANNNLIASTQNTYGFDPDRTYSETFHGAYTATNLSDGVQACDSTSQIKQYAVYKKSVYNYALTQQTTYKNGLTTTVSYTTFDAITGAPTVTTVIDPTQGTSISIGYPAYANSTYAALGSKVDDIANKNILGATYKQVAIKEDLSGAVVATTGGSYTPWQSTRPTWNPTSLSITNDNVWNAPEKYIYNGNTDASLWKDAGGITLFDKFSAPLEVKDVMGRHSANIYGYQAHYLVATAGNTEFRNFTYSSAEYLDGSGKLEGNNVAGSRVSAASVGISAHTGYYVAAIDGSLQGLTSSFVLNSTDKGRKYQASVWVHDGTDINNVKFWAQISYSDGSVDHVYVDNSTSLYQIDGWNLFNNVFTIDDQKTPTTIDFYETNTGGSTMYADDISVKPYDATMSCYVYDQYGNNTFLIDNSGLYTKNVYDAAGRVTETWKETATGVLKVSENKYHYARQ